MRQLLTIFTPLLLFGCSSPVKQPVDSNEQYQLATPQDTFSVNGLWVMPDYVDSILTYKNISKYRMQRPSWFSILIEIDNDTLRTYGSILDIEAPINVNSDTLHVFTKTISGKWTLSLNKQTQKLELRNTDSKKNNYDPKAYVFDQREDLKFLLDTLDPRHQTRTSFTNLFHDQLFKGTYTNIETEDQVTFGSNGQISGFEDFYKYNVDVYFGTFHPFNNLNNIRFYRKLPDNSNKYDWEVYKWEFHGDSLILTQFNWDLHNHKGRKVRGDIWKLSDKRIIMNLN